MPGREELPSTLQRSSKHAQEVWEKTHDSAVDTYGEGERAHRTAFSALKHQFEKVGDHWEEKDESGPSDKKAEGGRQSPGRTQGGVDENSTKQHLMGIAKRLDISGRSSMKKAELVEAIKKANDKATRDAR